MTDHLPAPPTRRQPMPLGLKIVLGLAVGCGTIALVAIVAGVAGVIWFVAPGKQVETLHVAGDDSVGLLVLSDPAADEGVSALLARLFLEFDAAANRARSEELPDSMRWLENLGQANRRQSVEGLKIYMPRELTVTLEPFGADRHPRVVLAANPRMFPRLFETMLDLVTGEQADVVEEQHGGQSYKRFPDGSALAFVGGTVLWAEEGSLLPAVLDRLGSGSNAGVRLSEPLEGSWDARGALVVDELSLDWLVGLSRFDAFAETRELLPLRGEILEELERLRFRVDVLSDDAIEATLLLEATASADPGPWAERVTVLLESYRPRAEASGLELGFKVTPEDDAVRAELRIDGLRVAIAAIARKAWEEREG